MTMNPAVLGYVESTAVGEGECRSSYGRDTCMVSGGEIIRSWRCGESNAGRN